jgi:hypothetical protein
MIRIFALVGLIIIFGGGFYYYATYRKNLQDPVVRVEKINELPLGDQFKALQKTAAAWVKDPVSQIPYPKGWRKVSVTTQGYTFDVVTPDTKNPPQYYASFTFPKSLVPKMHLIKCLGVGAKDKKTDVCVVGDNPVINAYFTIVGWFQNFTNNQLDAIRDMAPSNLKE